MKKIYLIVMGVILFFASMTIIIVNNINNNKQYLVTFDSNGGTVVESIKVRRNESVSKPADLTKEGYTFIEWQLNGEKYDFEKEVASDLELVAVWEKIKPDSKPNTNTNTNKPSNNSSNNTGTTTKPTTNTQNSSKPNTGNQGTSTDTTKLLAPTIIIPPMGGGSPDGPIYGYLQLDKVQGEVEIYYATSKTGEYKLLRTALKADHGTNNYEVSVPLGQHYYFKVRLKANGVYGNYSNVVDFDNSN